MSIMFTIPEFLICIVRLVVLTFNRSSEMERNGQDSKVTLATSFPSISLSIFIVLLPPLTSSLLHLHIILAVAGLREQILYWETGSDVMLNIIE